MEFIFNLWKLFPNIGIEDEDSYCYIDKEYGTALFKHKDDIILYRKTSEDNKWFNKLFENHAVVTIESKTDKFYKLKLVDNERTFCVSYDDFFHSITQKEKLKSGTKVKIVKNTSNNAIDEYIGRVGTIIKESVFGDSYKVEFDDDEIIEFYFLNLEPVKENNEEEKSNIVIRLNLNNNSFRKKYHEHGDGVSKDEYGNTLLRKNNICTLYNLYTGKEIFSNQEFIKIKHFNSMTKAFLLETQNKRTFYMTIDDLILAKDPNYNDRILNSYLNSCKGNIK